MTRHKKSWIRDTEGAWHIVTYGYSVGDVALTRSGQWVEVAEIADLSRTAKIIDVSDYEEMDYSEQLW